ncbi:hypothetical protein [Pseudomonas sp. NPDC087690]|uniref:hypothetical protein n=1 Tax=Pseudomonas sp. NPDC087690 TaxID=3364446 RepID=UPI00381A129C
MRWIQVIKKMTLDGIVSFVSFAANFTSSIASIIAIYLFVFKRKAIASVFSLLFNYSHQLTLSEIKEKLELLNNFNANDPAHTDTILNIFHDLLGQIRGNDKISGLMSKQILKLERLIDRDLKITPITEPKKRALISEIREKVRHLNVQNIDELAGSGS